jgi:formylglycine-generating enzyme required for sulfatase activity
MRALAHLALLAVLASGCQGGGSAPAASTPVPAGAVAAAPVSGAPAAAGVPIPVAAAPAPAPVAATPPVVQPGKVEAPVAQPVPRVAQPAAPADGAPEQLAMSAAPPQGLRWLDHPSHPFAILATEVTVAQFRACVEGGACKEGTFKRCNYGASGREAHPMNCVDFFGAEQFCRFAGGRTCQEDEWLAACSGTDGRPFPYGNAFDLDACNSQSATMKTEGRALDTVPVASLTRCEGGLPGLFDMAGNVTEWVDPCKGTYCKFRGGGFNSNDPVDRFAACTGVCSGNQKDFSSTTIGFRCCRDR